MNIHVFRVLISSLLIFIISNGNRLYGQTETSGEDSIILEIQKDIPVLNMYQWSIESGYTNELENYFSLISSSGDTLVRIEVSKYDNTSYVPEIFEKYIKFKNFQYVVGVGLNLDTLYLYRYSRGQLDKKEFLVGEGFYRSKFH